MTPELQILIGSIAGGAGALLSYWAGWRARGGVMRIRGGVIGRPPLILNEGRTVRRNPFVSDFQQQINDQLRRNATPPPPRKP